MAVEAGLTTDVGVMDWADHSLARMVGEYHPVSFAISRRFECRDGVSGKDVGSRDVFRAIGGHSDKLPKSRSLRERSTWWLPNEILAGFCATGAPTETNASPVRGLQ